MIAPRCCAIRANEPVSPQHISSDDDGRDSAAVQDPFDALLPGHQQIDAEPIVGKDYSVPPPPLPSGTARPLRSPRQPSAAERARHRITHLPYQYNYPHIINQELTPPYGEGEVN